MYLKSFPIGTEVKITVISADNETKKGLYRLGIYVGERISLIKRYRFGGFVVVAGESYVALDERFGELIEAAYD